MAARILVVDDESSVLDMVGDALRFAEHEVLLAPDAVTALSLIRRDPVALMICDVNMPGMNGFALLRHLRESGDSTPTILLTARQDFDDVAAGLRAGADDYIKKPFRLEELLLRVDAVLRRTHPPSSDQPLRWGPLEMSVERHQVLVDGAEVELSPTEFRLLECLLRDCGKTTTRRHLLDEIWGLSFVENASVVDTYMFYLRKKLPDQLAQSIRTVRGVGFRLVDPA